MGKVSLPFRVFNGTLANFTSCFIALNADLPKRFGDLK